MTKGQLQIEIENLAKEMDCTFIEAASAMQSASAQLGNDSMIATIGELKLESLGL